MLMLAWACSQPCLCDISYKSRWQVNQISQITAHHLPSYKPHNCFANRTDRSAPLVCFAWHKLGVKKIILAAVFCVFPFPSRDLFNAVVGKHLYAVRGTPNLVVYLCFLCFFFFGLSIFSIMYIMVFTWFGALREKTNKGMSSAPFIIGQSVISASTVVNLRRCRLICLSLSQTCLCGPLAWLSSCS